MRDGLRLKVIFCLIFVLIMSSCRQNNATDKLSGRVTLWHSWPSTDALVLEQALTQFQELHPDVQVITTAFPETVVI